MRHHHRTRMSQQARVNLRLLFEYIEAAAIHLSRLEGPDERGLVNDSAASCVDDDHAILHLAKLLVGEGMAGVFLGGSH